MMSRIGFFKRLAPAVSLYVLGSVVDYLTTYYLVFVRGLNEINPFVAPLLYSGMWMWVLRDFAFLGLVVSMLLLMGRVLEASVQRTIQNYVGGRASLFWYSLSWILAPMITSEKITLCGVLVAVATRLFLVSHNVCIVLTGCETPIVQFAVQLYSLFYR